MDERVRRIVMSRPVPMKLASALELAPDLTANRTPERTLKVCHYNRGSFDPERLSPTLLWALTLVCHGYTNPEISERTTYALDTVKDMTKVLLAVFNARNRAHLAALAVAQGYVDMTIAV